MMWIIYKQYAPGVNVWVKRIDETDTILQYETETDAYTALPQAKLQYPDRELIVNCGVHLDDPEG